MADGSNGASPSLTKGARITGDQRSSLATSFGQRYASGESIRSIAEDTGRSYGFVHGVLKESGTSLRGRGGATRGPRRVVEKVAEQVQAVVSDAASPERTKAKAAKKAGDKPAKAKAVKAVKDDKPKKKVEAKKPAKKGKKG